MRNFVLLAGALALMVTAACSVDAGVGVGPAAGGAGQCDAIACADALVNGLSPDSDAICDAAIDDVYQSLLDCACGTSTADPGACSDVCGDNLCQYGPESGACGDCLNSACGPEHDTCGNN